MRIRRIVVALLLLASSSALAQTKVTLWMHDHPPRVPLDKQLIAEFEQANPDITVDYQVVPVAEFDSKLITALSAGGGPDLFNQFTGAVGDFQALGALAPYGGDQQALMDEYAAGALDGATFDGKVYGLPTEVSNYACYTNNTLWNDAGLDANSDFPQTWEDMVDVAKQLTVRNDAGVLVQRGFDFNWTDPIFMILTFNPMVRQLGGALINTQTNEAQLTSPAVKKVMQYWSDWVNEYQLGGPQYTGSRDAFLAGQLATECSMAYPFVPQLREANIDFSVHPLPRWKDAVSDNGSDVYGYFIMVNARSKPDVQAAAWKLARYLTAHPAQYFDTAGLLQPTAEFMASDTVANNDILQVFMGELAKSKFMLEFPGFTEASAAITRARDRIVIGKEPIDTVLEQANQEVNDVLTRAVANAQR